MASEPHTVSSMKGPMTVRVAKVDFIDEEAHRERPVPAEQVVLVPYVDMLYIQLDSLEERSEEGDANRLLKL